MNLPKATISDPKGLMKLKFKCPECGGYRWGTSNMGNWDEAIGHCHEYPCKFTWKRRDDDKEGVFIPKDGE